MSTLLIDRGCLKADNVPRYCRKHILKSRENIFKPECNKALKKKLKKYKLRRDGQEDPDIVDVSQTLISSLRIKSPNNQNIITQKDRVTEENRPYNYLSKMVRLKKTTTELVSITPNIHNDQIEDEIITITSKSDQDKQQMDAFKVLMDSQNKSIGSNSPGKEKCVDECQLQTKKEKSDLKAKRILSLNKMAEAKGSLKKLEIEEYREENIKRKMEDRAIRLKDIIVDVKKKNGKKGRMKPCNEKLHNKPVSPTNPDVRENKERKKDNDNTTLNLETFNLFKDLKASPSKKIQSISKEDEEFLKKLSPSIRKKENMLCYFQKINKDLRDSETSQDDIETDFQKSDNFIIKVKLSSKTTAIKKTKKSNHVINFTVTDDKNKICEPQSHDFDPNYNSHKMHVNDGKVTRNENVDGLMTQKDDSRPKRNSKRPVKYSDDFQLTSSDEELHIFTPKKKRKEKCDSQRTVKAMTDDSSEMTVYENSKMNRKNVECKRTKLYEIKRNPKKNKEVRLIKPKTKTTVATSKATKLAPIFVKTQLDPVALEAKQKFLHSGVPRQVKKSTIQQTNVLTVPDEFHTVVHVQNLSYVNTFKIKNLFDLIDMNSTEDIFMKDTDNLFERLLDRTILVDHGLPKFNKNVELILKDIKTFYPKFPVYRTYHLLRGKSKGEFRDCIYPDLDNSVEIFNNIVDSYNINPDKLNWSDKYKPTAERQVIGNFESMKELRRWLVTWTENNAKSKLNKDDGTDSSDFYQSDADSKETMKNFNNSVIITGPVGSGKTLSVYAVAAELAIKVIEVNASTKRTGKIMLQDLQEATQSHKVDRGKSGAECFPKTTETYRNKGSKTMKKPGKKKKSSEDFTKKVDTTNEVSNDVSGQENRPGMSLILIDDADIVFDQDDGFCSAISQLIQTSKRPVILVASSVTCPHLQKFLHLAKIIKMRPFLPKMLGTWLDIMCLVDSNMCSPGLGAKTLELFKGDIRKTINYLQFYVTSHKYLADTDSPVTSQREVLKLNADDENSCMSWSESEGWCNQNTVMTNSDDIVLKYYVKKQLQLLHPLSSLSSFSIWWNLPDILDYSTKHKKNNPIEKPGESGKSSDTKELNVIAGMLNIMSVTDLLENSDLNGGVNTTLRPWYSYESASVIDNENLASYNRNNECINNIAFELMTKGISEAQRVLECDIKTEINYPNMSLHRDRDKVVSRHKILTNSLNPSGSLDRRALALDYWATCRNICRIEKAKTSNNSKRNNRYCHYLKSLNVLCKNDYFDNLSQSLI